MSADAMGTGAPSAPQPTRLADYKPPLHHIESLDLAFDLDPEATRVASRIVLSAIDGAPAPLVLDGANMKLIAVAVDGRPLGEGDYVLDAESLTLKQVPARCTVEITGEIAPARNTKLEGLYVSGGMFCTQCEAQGFRRITWFPDRPDVMTVYTVTIRADAAHYPVLLSNGNRVSERRLENGRHEAVWHDPFPKPAYLFALVAGNLGCLEDKFTTASGRTVDLRIWTDKADVPRCGYAMDALKRSMRWDEESHGLEYDLDQFNIVAVGDFNMGAMENKSLNIFNAKYVMADPDTATDTDYAFIETIVAHEYFHNWTGDRITCRDWFQLSLKEGLTVFRDQQFSADMRSAAVKRIRDVRTLRARQFQEDGGPLAHPVRPASYIEINNFYTATVYDKGAELIRMMHTLLGADGYRRGIDLYVQRHDGQAVTCDDFVAAMADANGVDFAQFSRWYAQAGTPTVTAEGKWDAAARRYTLTLTQATPPTPGQPTKQALHMPIAVGLIGPDGKDMAVRLADAAEARTTTILPLREGRQSFVFEDVPAAPVPSVNRGFSAPIKLEMPGETQADQAFLMANDSDPFNRWEAGQRYGTRLLLDMVGAIQEHRPLAIDPAFVGAIGKILADPAIDPAFCAQAITLPSEDFIADAMAVVDVDAIHAAHLALRRAIAAEHKDTLHGLYGRLRDNTPYSPDAAPAGRRALKNTALSLLAELGEPGITDMVVEQYGAADNMTDRMAALGILNDSPAPARKAALDAFYRRYADDAVTIDKWFALQATSVLPDTLATVAALTTHPAFTLRNPNKVRALISSFASANPLRFHAADGSGYAFFADRIIELEKLNPVVAARILAPLGRWRRFDAGRQAKMRAALERILAVPNLSRDVYEIAAKSLG